MRRYRRKYHFTKISLPYVLLLLMAILFSAFMSDVGISQKNIYQFLVVLAAFGGVCGIVFIWRIDSITRRRRHALQISEIDSMQGVEFEKYIGEIFKFQKYTVVYTPSSNDYGVDIIARRDGISYAIQIKRYKDKLDSSPVREAVAGMSYYSCDKSVVVTNSYFSTNAQKLAEVNSCILIDRNKLVSWIDQYQQKKVVSKLL